MVKGNAAPWLFAGLLLLLVTMAAAKEPVCSQDWVCVRVADDGEQVEFLASNLKPWPLTITLKVKGRHLSPRRGRTVTRTVPGQQEQALLTLSVDDRLYSYSYEFDWTVGSLAPAHDPERIYLLPYGVAEAYPVLQGFGSPFSHTGRERYAVDFDMPIGTPVHAARDGVVAKVVMHNDRGCWERACGKFANYIIVLHDDGSTGEYYHLDHLGAVVSQGEVVAAGQLIGRSGNTGHTTMPHLHFAVYRADTWGRTQSLRFRFASKDGVISRPRVGQSYQAAAE
jgi:murein DD-endopeptidase MepM/ murein hydrolase activator NlpD